MVPDLQPGDGPGPSASNAVNYRIEDLGQNSNPAAGRGVPVPIAQAIFDPASRGVTLIPARPLIVGRFYRVVVNGPGAPGLTSASNVVLDGDQNGLPDGIYTSLIGRGTRTRPVALQVGVPSPRPPKAHAVARKPAAPAIARDDDRQRPCEPALTPAPVAPRRPRPSPHLGAGAGTPCPSPTGRAQLRS